MQSFEYLRAIGIGYYVPGTSYFHQRDARFKILFFVILIIALTFTSSLSGLLLGVLLGLLGFWLAHISVLPSLRTMRSVLPFILLLFILQIFLYRPTQQSTMLWEWQFLHLYDTALTNAMRMVLRFVGLVLMLGLMTSVVSTLEMNHGLELLLRPLRVVGIQTDSLVMVLQIMLRFLPLLAIRMEQIAKSQASRGATWDKGSGGVFNRIRLVLPMIVPLFLSTLQQAERTADAMLCRAYGVMPERSHYYEYQVTGKDVVFIVTGIILAAAILYF
ncbi:MAG TPA: hypothetical protein DCK95_06370 [Anaerolineaceae bacterium]|nr:hypothetical protein [Anaerolineaceae bacterium]